MTNCGPEVAVTLTKLPFASRSLKAGVPGMERIDAVIQLSKQFDGVSKRTSACRVFVVALELNEEYYEKSL